MTMLLMRTIFFLFFIFSGFVQLVAQPLCVKDVCCCDKALNEGVPSGTFQDSPLVSPGTLRTFYTGEQYGNWSILNGSIDVKGQNYFNLAQGNPNGKSQFIDLNGQAPGTIATQLNNLSVGMTYTLVFWYAMNPATDTARCRIQVAGGAWVDDTLKATNPGNVIWLERCYTFIALDTTAELRYTGLPNANPAAGMLLDDMSMWRCPIDTTPPVISSFPVSPITLECDAALPPTDYPPATDDCSVQTTPTFFSEQMTPDSCMYTLLRTWVVSDDCGNTSTATQEIRVQDTQAPVFSKDPVDYVVNCGDDYLGIFNQWLANHADGDAADNCSPAVTWSYAYSAAPDGSCSSTPVTFTISDDCGNAQSVDLTFTVEDKTPPLIIRPAQNETVTCSAFGADSLAIWLANRGGALANDPCSPLVWSHDFAGDSTAQVIQVTFTVTDACLNSAKTTAFFYQPFVSDTIVLFASSCNPSETGSDTSKTYLGNCETVTVLNTLLLPSDTTYLFELTCFTDSVGLFTQNLINQFGCDSTVYTDVTLALLPQLSVTPSDFNGYGVSCAGSTDGLANAATTGVGPYGYNWSAGSGSGATINGLSAGNYGVTVTDANGCTDTAAFELTEPSPLSVEYQITELDCLENETGIIGVLTSGGVAPYSYALDNGEWQTDSLFPGLIAGAYAITTTDTNGCTYAENVIMPELIEVEVYIGENQTVELGDMVYLQASVNIPFGSLTEVVWTPTDSATCLLCLNRSFTPAQTGTYAIQVTDNKGCVDEDSLLVQVVRQIRIFVPNVFSPNDDGLDDEFLVFAKPGQVQQIKSLMVFDRWGSPVFSRKNIAPNDPYQGWNGTYKADRLNPGVYVWIAEVEFIDGTVERFEGDVTLLR